jgi:PIN domain nuclease of toxin-antitoxin system
MGRHEVTAPLLDTHAWLWWLRRERRLGASVFAALDDLAPDERPYLADISLWEVAMLVDRGRLVLSEPLQGWLEAATHPRLVTVVAISPSIAAETAVVTRALRDPADRLIVATSRALQVPILTHDKAIIQSRLAKRWVPST